MFCSLFLLHSVSLILRKPIVFTMNSPFISFTDFLWIFACFCWLLRWQYDDNDDDDAICWQPDYYLLQTEYSTSEKEETTDFFSKINFFGGICGTICLKLPCFLFLSFLKVCWWILWVFPRYFIHKWSMFCILLHIF